MAAPPAAYSRHRAEPRISANELAKYMVTPAPGRIGIIRRTRDSVTPPRTRYTDLRSGIAAFLADRRRDGRTLTALATMLEQRVSDSSASNFARQDAQLSLAALASFQRMQSQLAPFVFVPAPARQRPLAIGGVAVSINLDLLVPRVREDRTECSSALFRLIKADEGETDAAAGKRREMGGYATTLAQMQVRAAHYDGAIPHHELCMSVDVQCGEVHIAPRNEVSADRGRVPVHRRDVGDGVDFKLRHYRRLGRAPNSIAGCLRLAF